MIDKVKEAVKTIALVLIFGVVGVLYLLLRSSKNKLSRTQADLLLKDINTTQDKLDQGVEKARKAYEEEAKDV